MCHRLTTLRRPGTQGIPFHFLRVDIAGHVSKRFAGTNMRIPKYGGLCPRWNVHRAFTMPGRIDTQFARMPDGDTYICIARAFAQSGARFGEAQIHYAVSIGAELSHAGDIVYADGFDLESEASITPVGTNCRVCERVGCRQRAQPALIGAPSQANRDGTPQAEA